MIKSAVVIANPEKKWAVRVRGDVEKFLLANGIAVKRDNADLLITIGGDGTILHNKGLYPFPIFGIGHDRSFICQAKADNWRSRLGKALSRNEYDERGMLACTVDGMKTEAALNEVCVRNSEYRIVEFSLRADGRKYEFRADGAIFSTPTGSSAHAYSCGGRELHREGVYEIVPMAPYRRAMKPLILPNSVRSMLTVKSGCKGEVVIDGQFSYAFDEGSVIRVYAGPRSVKFLK